ncbi:hypothetical protein Pat9b_4754 (plasmid) [Pantoea sp. At-9b]|nr:hypothetical protein Pat9b_4754 [Pantoea sp. At-9b]
MLKVLRENLIQYPADIHDPDIHPCFFSQGILYAGSLVGLGILIGNKVHPYLHSYWFTAYKPTSYKCLISVICLIIG